MHSCRLLGRNQELPFLGVEGLGLGPPLAIGHQREKGASIPPLGVQPCAPASSMADSW